MRKKEETRESRAEQSRAEQSRAEQSRAEQSRAEQSRAEQSSVFGCFEGNMCVFGGMYSRPFSWKSW